jgi:hypothetical protein
MSYKIVFVSIFTLQGLNEALPENRKATSLSDYYSLATYAIIQTKTKKAQEKART